MKGKRRSENRPSRATTRRPKNTAFTKPTAAINIPEGKTIGEFLGDIGLSRIPRTAKKPRGGKWILHVQGGRRYGINRVLAKGGMGIVYEAEDLNCHRQVAMKLLSRDVIYLPKDLLRFIEEARITSQMEHPNIVPIHELGLDVEGRVFYTMKYVRGLTLTEILLALRKGRKEIVERFPLSRLLNIFQKVCDAVAFAHANGVIHRDLKPDNIMVGDYGEVLVMDWGLAKDISGSEEGVANAGAGGSSSLPDLVGGRGDHPGTRRRISTTRTISRGAIGTPGFVAPEQLFPQDKKVDSRADIYSLGATLYSILTLHAPIGGRSVRDVVRKILAGQIMPPGDHSVQHSRRLPHCPEGRIPNLLSEIAMKALATEPVNRYASVQDLQRDIEAYQNGRAWQLVVDERFSDSEVFSRWEVAGGTCQMADGELRLSGGAPEMLLLKNDLPGDVRMEFECRQEGVNLNDVGCIMASVRHGSPRDMAISGYQFKCGAYNNTMNVLSRLDRILWSKSASPLASGRKYLVCAERIGPRLRMTVNGEEIFDVVDPYPLTGSNRTMVGLFGWMSDNRYSEVRVYTLSTPWKSDILDLADSQLRHGHYRTAIDLYHEVLASFPDAERKQRATQGSERARRLYEMDQQLPAWRVVLGEAWPGVDFSLRIEDGLVLEVWNAGIRDLSAVKELPLSAFYCCDNEITSLEPLRGMRLTNLKCSRNPIDSLEPLRGMPLSTLLADACRFTSLDPLRDAQALTVLSCSQNRLGDGLEPLRGLKLTWLACVECGIKDLSPLAGMWLTELYCDNNEIEDLAPLRGMPLTALTFSANHIESLDALQGMLLNALHFAQNRVRNLAPLRNVPLGAISCQDNRIESLEPLKGLALHMLMCGANPLRGIEPLHKNPPRLFLFDSDSISTHDLEWLHQTWARDFRHTVNAREVAILLAVRRNDAAALRALSNKFDGHHYLFVPRFLCWEDARKLSETFGGHLVTISSKEKSEFVDSILPYGNWLWMGLLTKDGRQSWVTGEPFAYNAFLDLFHEKAPGPKVFSCRNWYREVVPGARNCFMIEWDS